MEQNANYFQAAQAGAGAGQMPPVKPDNYLIWAILTTICCCLPFGIVSIVFSSKVNSLWMMGQYAAAQQAAADAKKWATIAAICGIVFDIIYFAWYFIVGAAMIAAGSF